MSGRAAARLLDMGFKDVYAYEAGKSDWFAAGLERAGESTTIPRIGDFMEMPPTCSPDDTVGAARKRAEAAGWDACVVVDADGIVLGLLRSQLRQATGTDLARDVMHNGPKTYRADYTLPDPVEYMLTNKLDSTIVTSPEGRLLGMALLEPARKSLAEYERLLDANHKHDQE